MKIKLFPYDLKHVKKYLIKKNYQHYKDGNYSHYRKMFEYLYPNLSQYYIRNIILDLIECEFFIVRFSRGRRIFSIKTKAQSEDIGFITF